MKDVAVITVTYKFPKDLLKNFILSLRSAGIKRKDIFIRDNTSDDIGYAAGLNKILKHQLKRYRYFFIVNPDIILDKECINKLLNVLKSRKDVGIVGPKILNKNGRVWSVGGVVDKRRYSAGLSKTLRRNIDFVPGTAMLIKSQVFEKVGLFPEDYFLYYDEVDFCFRTKKLGFNIAIVPNAKIIHFESSTVGKSSPAMIYFMARNHLYFVEKFAPLGVKIRELVRLPKTVYQAKHNTYELAGIRDFFLRKTGNNRNFLSKVDL